MEKTTANPTAESFSFAEGFTVFTVEAGFDLIVRSTLGESKGRLSELDADDNVVGSMFEPNDDPNAEPKAIALKLVIDPKDEDTLVLHYGSRTWTLTRPDGKDHFFGYWNQWPKKSKATSLRGTLANLKKLKAKS